MPAEQKKIPKILVFSTNIISDPGIDMAGSAHMHYSAAVRTVTLPCSSSIRPSWVLHAIESGFDGVFIAACGGDCAYLTNCTDLTSNVIKESQKLLKEKGHNPRRLKMSAICSVCAEAFVGHMKKFSQELEKLNAEEKEKVDSQA